MQPPSDPSRVLPPLSRDDETKNDDKPEALGNNPFDLEPPQWRSLDSLVSFDGPLLPDELLFRSAPGDEEISRSGPTLVHQPDLSQFTFEASHVKLNELPQVDELTDLYQSLASPSEPPAPKGGYIEPNYHATLANHCSPADVFTAVQDTLRHQEVDFCIFEKKYKLNCAAYFEGSKIPFKVRIYTVTYGSKRFVIEFQRRSGNTLRFGEIYRTTMVALYDQQLLCEGFEVPPEDLPSLGSLPRPSMITEKAPATIHILRQMASSSYEDVRCEALRSLCEIAAEKDSKLRNILLDESIVDVFVEFYGSSCEDAQRCALTGLANLTSVSDAPSKSWCYSLLDRDVVKGLCKTLKASGANGAFTGYTHQIIREIARVLLNVATQTGEAMAARVQKDVLWDAYLQLENSSDSSVRNYALAMANIDPLAEALRSVHSSVAAQ